MNQEKIKLRRNLVENDGQYKGMADGIPRKACTPAGYFPIEAFSSPGGDSQAKFSPSGLNLLLLAFQPLYVPCVEEGATWNDLPRGL